MDNVAEQNVEQMIDQETEVPAEQKVETGKKKKEPVVVPNEFEKLVQQIAEAKKNKDWKTAFNLTGRLINKINHKINKLQTDKKKAETEEYKQLVVQAKALLNENRKNLKSYYKKCLNSTKKYANDIGKIRKAYITYVEKEIKRLSKMESLDAKDQKYLDELNAEYPTLLTEYKQNLSERYSSTLNNTGPTLVSLLTTLPKSCGIAIDKIVTCIKDIKNAKDNKDKFKKIVDVVKNSGLLVATPILFVGKFAIEAVLCIVFGTSLNLTGKALSDFITRVKDKLGSKGKNLPQNESNLAPKTVENATETSLTR